MGEATGAILCHFESLPDPRAGNVIHKLHDLVVLAVCAVVCGADGWVEVELFARSKFAWFKTFLDLPGGAPSHDTFNRVFARLDPDAFEARFTAWAAALAGGSGGKLIAVDGKAIRRSFERAWDKSGMAHLVSAFVADDRLAFARVAVDGKGNEITAIPKLLALLDLRGATVTADAVGCRRAAAGRVVAVGGDYVPGPEEDRPRVGLRLPDPAREGEGDARREAVLPGFAGVGHGRFEPADGGHGRLEARRVRVAGEVHWARGGPDEPWPHPPGGGPVGGRFRQDPGDPAGKVTVGRRYLVGSRAGADARATAAAVRGHGSVGHNLRWQPGVSVREDECRIRVGHGAENFPPAEEDGPEPAHAGKERRGGRPRQTARGGGRRASPAPPTRPGVPTCVRPGVPAAARPRSRTRSRGRPGDGPRRAAAGRARSQGGRRRPTGPGPATGRPAGRGSAWRPGPDGPGRTAGGEGRSRRRPGPAWRARSPTARTSPAGRPVRDRGAGGRVALARVVGPRPDRRVPATDRARATAGAAAERPAERRPSRVVPSAGCRARGAAAVPGGPGPHPDARVPRVSAMPPAGPRPAAGGGGGPDVDTDAGYDATANAKNSERPTG